MNYPEMIDPKEYDLMWKQILPSDLEEVFHAKFKDDLILFTSDYFEIFNHPESAYCIRINEENHHPFVYPQQWKNATIFPVEGEFSSKSHNVLAVEAHQSFLHQLVLYVFGLKEIRIRWFYHTSRTIYDVVKKIYILDGIDKTLVPYLQEGYSISGHQYLVKSGHNSIRVVWDHYNYPEPYFKKLLIYCIKHRVWPSFNIFLQEAFYPTGKVRILPKKVHDDLGSSEDNNRGTMYQDAKIEVCEVLPPYKDKSNTNIWTPKKEKHLVSQSRLDV